MDLRRRRSFLTYDMACRKKKWRYRIRCRIQCRIPYRIRYLSVKLRQCAVRQFPFLFEHLTAVTKMGSDVGTAMMNEITRISSPHLRAPCNTILHLRVRLPAFFVMCQTGVFLDKKALDKAISQLPVPLPGPGPPGISIQDALKVRTP